MAIGPTHALPLPGEVEKFTDREAERARFREAIEEHQPLDRHRVLAFYGVGGQGKTALCAAFERLLDDERKDERVAFAALNFADASDWQVDRALLQLRQQLSEQKIRFPAFTAAYLRLLKLREPSVDPRQRHPELFSDLTDLAEYLGVITEGAGKLDWLEILADIPGVSQGIKLAGRGYDRYRAWMDRKGKRLIAEQADLKEGQLLEKLPVYFGSDLCDHLFERAEAGTARRIVIILDTYEALWRHQTLKVGPGSHRADAWVRQLVSETPGVLFVTLSRNLLGWTELDAGWGPIIQEELLGGFSDSDADVFLRKYHVGEADIRKRIIDSAKGVPFYIDLQANTYVVLRSRGQTPTPDMFGGTEAQILDRFLSHFDPDARHALQALAHPRHVTSPIFDALRASDFPHASHLGASEILRQPQFEMRPGDRFVMHDLLREHLIDYVQRQQPDRAARLHRVLHDHYRQICEAADPGNLSASIADALLEAAYHLTRSDRVGSAVWLGMALDNFQSAPTFGLVSHLYQHVRDELSELVADRPDELLWRHHLSISWERIAGVKRRYGDVAGALDALMECMAIQKQLAQAEPRNPDLQRDLAVCQHNIGDIKRDAGDLSGALGPYANAFKILHELARSQPTDNELQRDLSQSYERIGDVKCEMGQLDGSLSAYRNAMQIHTRLAKINPTNRLWQHDLSIGHIKIGNIERDKGNLAAALDSYAKSVTIARHLTETDANDALRSRHLSVCLISIGDVHQRQGNLTAAFAAYSEQIAVIQRLATADPRNVEWQRDLSIGYERTASIKKARNDLPGALADSVAALAITERLAASDPRNAQWQRDLAVAHSDVGDLRFAQGNVAGALAAFGKSLALRQKLAEADPRNAGLRREVAIGYANVGDAKLWGGDGSGAHDAYVAALAVREDLVKTDPNNAEWQRDLVTSYNRLGDALCARSDFGSADRAYAVGMTIARRLAESDPSNAQWQFDIVASHQRIGKLKVAQGDRTSARQEYEAGRELLKRLLARDPSHPDWRLTFDMFDQALRRLGD